MRLAFEWRFNSLVLAIKILMVDDCKFNSLQDAQQLNTQLLFYCIESAL